MSETVRAVSDFRGTFNQGSRATLFLKITDFLSIPHDAQSITCSISQNSVIISSGVPEKVQEGYYAYDWDIDPMQTTGQYDVLWSYVVDDGSSTESQTIIVSQTNQPGTWPSLYAGRILEFRQNLEYMILCAQSIPVYSEQAKPSADKTIFHFTWPRWNQSPGCRIYVNDVIQESGFTINYFKGKVIFDEPLTQYDRVRADYNFRWFEDVQLDRFLSNAVNYVNLYPPVSTGTTLMNLPDRYIPLVIWQAAVDALRTLMMCIQFQQPAMVFGGSEEAAKAFGNFETLKKNYEEQLKAGLDVKKYGPYKGLTKTIVTPEFALPGGRSRWFRYLFSNGC